MKADAESSYRDAPVQSLVYMFIVLAGLGVSSLSMAPSKVPVVRLALSLHTLPECQGMATEARNARTAMEALEAVRSRARSELTDLL